MELLPIISDGNIFAIEVYYTRPLLALLNFASYNAKKAMSRILAPMLPYMDDKNRKSAIKSLEFTSENEKKIDEKKFMDAVQNQRKLFKEVR